QNPSFPRQRVIHHSRASKNICHLQIISPRAGELFYLHSLLMYVPARSFEQLRIVDGTVHPTFQDTAIALGLFTDCLEAIQCLEEARQLQSSPREFHFLFIQVVLNLPCNALDLFNSYW